ncbi:MAG TPA: hypothetical protein VHY91_21015 [Pirellulales bacterium]|jgi:Flp pilus assembly secretin CpaC|nr:hypothetical protein [Pirellulales bacterium]
MRLTATCLLFSVLGLSTVARGEQPLLSSPELVAIPPAIATAPSTMPAISTDEKIAHLEQAAEHLAAAGMSDQAKQARHEADALREKEQKQNIVDRLLKKKLAELERLQAEVDELRAAAGHTDQILVHLQVVQVLVAKMRSAGFDFPEREADCGRAVFPSLFTSQSDNGQPRQAVTIRAGQYKEVAALVEALRQQHLLKIVAEPTLVMTDKRPGYFESGGELPFPVPQSQGTVSIQFRKFGTQVDLMPKLLGKAKVRLAIHSRFGELDPTLAVKIGDLTVPGIKSHEIDADFDAEFGQTTVLSEVAQQEVAPPDAEAVISDEGKPEAPAGDEVRTFFLVTAEPVTPRLLEHSVVRTGGCPCGVVRPSSATTEAIDYDTARLPQTSGRR